jgi:hypothetical protein
VNITQQLRRLVQERAQGRCEYCGLSQSGQEALFHVDHVVPITAKGETEIANLALACVSCSLRKGARQFANDPDTGMRTPIFNPRHDQWHLHFQWKGMQILGLTPVGRATIEALRLNRPLILAIREEEAARGRHPPTIHL